MRDWRVPLFGVSPDVNKTSPANAMLAIKQLSGLIDVIFQAINYFVAVQRTVVGENKCLSIGDTDFLTQ
ncbi:MAG: hypothetical protein IT524_08490 [Nitrosomonas sp.]|nr:hypothetical protein [Nitrosomonas sp.]